uniref:MFS domain-containing protein n=1 Tax=Caenorhabditis tropicalis TaxID=1561998 RepID=A0A1I7TXB2_9PELO
MDMDMKDLRPHTAHNGEEHREAVTEVVEQQITETANDGMDVSCKIEIIRDLPAKNRFVPDAYINETIEVLPEKRVAFQNVGDSKRWLMMILVVLINFSNTCSWIAYAPVGNYVNGFYGEATATWISMVFLLIAVPFSFIGMYIGSVTGVTAALLCAACPNFFGALVRWMSSLSAINPAFRFQTLVIGQVVAGASYTFLLYLPSKVSDTWFPPSERTLATTIGVMANPAGVMFVNLISPLLVQSSRDVPILNAFLALLCSMTMLAVFFGIFCYKTKENVTTDLKSKLFFESMGRCFKNRTYIILFISLGGGIAMFNSLYTMMSQMICPSGHGNAWAGYYAISMIVAGIVGATIASSIVDTHRCYKEVMIVSMTAASLFGIAFIWMTRVEGIIGRIGLLIFSILLGTFGLAAYPVGLELAIECTYPVSPEVSSGFIVLMGQIMSIVMVYILKYFSKKIIIDDNIHSAEVCRTSSYDSINIPNDYFVPIIIVSIIATFLAIITMFMNPKYERSKNNNDNRFKKSDAEANKIFAAIASSTDID